MKKQKKYAIAILTTATLWAAVSLNYLRPILSPSLTKKTSPPPLQLRLTRYIKDAYIAEEISKSKEPILLAAIAQVESEYKPQVKGKHGEEGLFQIRVSIHPNVGYSERIADQVSACEAILYPLIKKHGLRRGIMRYNGSGPATIIYANKVIKVMTLIKNS